MKAAVIHRYGKGEVLAVEDIPEPELRPHEVLVDVHAASVNPIDAKIRAGATKVILKYRFPLTLGNDLSGVVAAVGSAVTRWKTGDEVFARLPKDRIGAFAERAAVAEDALARKPASLTHVEAASIPLVGLTSWQALRDIGKLERGQTVLIHAGAGGVGTFAIQLARFLGARVATTASARNHELVKSLGADVVVDYRTQRFEDVLRDVDLVFDTQGGETLLRSFEVVKRGGTVVTVGGRPDGAFAKAWGLNPLLVLILSFLSRGIRRRAAAKEARFEYLFMRADGAQLAEIAELLEAGTVKPVIDRTFPLARVKDAMAHVESGKATGKVVVEVR